MMFGMFGFVNKICVCLFVSIHALRGAKGEDAQIFAPTGICVTMDDGRILGNSIISPV